MEPLLLEITVVTPVANEGAGAPASDERSVHVRGEVDMSSAGQLAEFLSGVLADGATKVVIDASDISFLDSTGLRVLVDVATRLEAAGGTLVVEPMSSNVRRVLEMTGLLDRYSA